MAKGPDPEIQVLTYAAVDLQAQEAEVSLITKLEDGRAAVSLSPDVIIIGDSVDFNRVIGRLQAIVHTLNHPEQGIDRGL